MFSSLLQKKILNIGYVHTATMATKWYAAIEFKHLMLFCYFIVSKHKTKAVIVRWKMMTTVVKYLIIWKILLEKSGEQYFSFRI